VKKKLEGQIKDVWRLAVGAILLVVLGFIKDWKGRGHLFKPEGKRIYIRKRGDGTSPDGL